MPQFEIKNNLAVLDDLGHPHNFGWSRSPSFFYDPALVAAPKHRISEADRYIVHTPTHLIIFEIRDDSWLGLVNISVINLRDKKRSTQIFHSLLPIGKYELPTTSVTGSVKWRKKKSHLDFIPMENGIRIIKADIPTFGRYRSLRGALVLSEPTKAESLVTNQRWRGEKFPFRYSRCSPWYFVEGVIQFGTSEIVFTKGNAWGIFDWNRWARPKGDIRYWASACGMSGGRQLGFCVGHSWADQEEGTDNAFFVDGKLNKLDKVTFDIPPSDWLSPWRFTGSNNSLKMTFTPHQERIERRNFFFYYSTRRQVCGFFSGHVQLEDGSIIEFSNLTGFAERAKTRL